MFKRNVQLAVLGVAALASPVLAQSTLDWPTGEFQSYRRDSGVHANGEQAEVVVYETTVEVEDAVWMRLYFSEVQLDRESYVRMTSAFDLEVQELDAAGLAMWSDTSAYFNGDTVHLELVAGPNTTANRVVLDRVAVYIDPGWSERGATCGATGCGYCGSDSRVPSDEDWSGRLMPVGCTATIYNEQSCLVSAGHCMGSASVIHFRVPDSSSSCYPYSPGVGDQFPITGYLFANGGVGNDWSVLTTGTNSYGETAYERYGVMRPIAGSLGSPGQTVGVWGFGVDTQPTRSQTQQTHSGSIYARYSTYYRVNVDITYGNSGSGLILNDQVIGIVTHCPCPNVATRVDRSAFVSAREQLCGGGASDYCFASSASTSYEYISNVSVGSIDNDSGASAYSDFTSLSTDMEVGTGYGFTVTLDTEWDSDIGGLWIDWNQDDDFTDTGETITTSWSGLGPYSTTITPPVDAVTGSTRMRVRIQDGEYDPTLSPCGATDYGEVEDYTVNVFVELPDTSAPSPNPMEYSTDPWSPSPYSASMTAALGIDDTPPVEYYFDFVSGGPGGGNSGWQTSRDYTDGGLAPNTYYSYRLIARDSASPSNIGSYSTTEGAYTLASTPLAPALSGVTASTIDLNVNPNDNPSNTEFAIQCSSTSPYDPTWDGKYVSASGNPTSSAVWRTDSVWGTKTIGNLNPETQYSFRVKARNEDGLETGLGPTASATTDECDTSAQCADGAFCNGAETCDGGSCYLGSDPCPGQLCDEGSDQCVNCLNDGDCADGAFCNGAEDCIDGSCYPGSDPCPGQSCDEENDVCIDDSCPWDHTGDGLVNPADIQSVIANFGCDVDDPVTGEECARHDHNGDDLVNPADIQAVIAHFGPCPR